MVYLIGRSFLDLLKCSLFRSSISFDVERWFREKTDDNPVSILGQREDDIGQYIDKKTSASNVLFIIQVGSIPSQLKLRLFCLLKQIYVGKFISLSMEKILP